MKTTQFKKIALSAEMMDANQISSTFVHKDGTQDIGNINLSGNFIMSNGKTVFTSADYNELSSNACDKTKASGTNALPIFQNLSSYLEKSLTKDIVGEDAIAGGCGFALGKYSTAIGYHPRGAEKYGDRPFALGESSIAVGNLAKATDRGAAAFGSGFAASQYSFAACGGNALEEQAFALGGATAKGNRSVAFGGSVTATGIAAVAQGHNNIAKGQYSHVEGGGCTTGFDDYDQNKTYVIGEYVSYNSQQGNQKAFVCISTNSVTDKHAPEKINENVKNYPRYKPDPKDPTKQIDTWSNDYWQYAYGNVGQHAEGSDTNAYAAASHTEGAATRTYGYGSHAEGCSTKTTLDANHAHVGGYQSVVDGSFGFVQGYQCIGTSQSVVLGRNAQSTLSNDVQSVHSLDVKLNDIVKWNNELSNWQIITDYSGETTGVDARFFNDDANSEFKLLQNQKPDSSKYYKVIDGVEEGETHPIYVMHQTGALGAKTTNSFVWSATSQGSDGPNGYRMYSSHGSDTFNINPRNGMSGFYIGENNFLQCITEAIKQIATDPTAKAALKTELNKILA